MRLGTRCRMDDHRPTNLIIISISMMYWFKPLSVVECWKFDARSVAFGNIGIGGGGLSSSISSSGHSPAGGTNPSSDPGGTTRNSSGGNAATAILNSPASGTGAAAAVTVHHDILNSCVVNSMCQCTGLPNETSTLIEINCNEISLYKFPEFLQSSLRFMEMSKTQLQSIDDETFQGLRLETLKLIDSKLLEISERSFNSMTHSLISLDISGNQLQRLPFNALRSLHVLSRLIAQRNHITSLDGSWGSLCDTLRSLHVSSNTISEVLPYNFDEEATAAAVRSNTSSTSILTVQQHHHHQQPQQQIRPFAKLRKLVWLDLGNNRISHLQASAFPRTIVTIDLSRNLLSTFPQQLFEHLHDLRIISLRDNLIRTISFRDIRVMRLHLEKLDISSNLLEDITPEFFHYNFSSIHVKALNLEKNFLKVIPAHAFKSLEGVAHLVMAFNDISRIHFEAFYGISSTLEYLDLERNELQSVPGAIRNLNSLKYLYLTSNSISHLSNLPEVTTALKVLSLSGNNFTTIPSEGLRNYTELSYLNMGYNKISDIKDDAFVGWGSQLQTILLRNNKITQLGSATFNGLDSIKEISVSFNDIHYVNPDVFENVSKTLKILELSFGIYRDDFPLEALQPLTELVWLGLDNNNLKLVTDQSLARMRDLSYINLSFNRIVNLPRNLFSLEVHQHLVDVDLSYNLIGRIVSNSFDSLGELQNVNLASNRIKTLERHSFVNLQILTYIDLSYNRLKNISDAAFAYLPSLLKVDMMHNSLCAISLRMFSFISNLTLPLKLNVSHNRITTFDDDLTSYLYMYHLDISFNLISNSLSFSNLGNTLKILNLMGNSLHILGNHAFGDLEYLEILNLSHNNISSLRRRSFQGLNRLQELDLSFNRLEQLQVEQFSNLKNLRILKMRNNRLRAFPREVFLNTRLEYLDISDNLLTVWPVPAFSDVGFTLRNIQFAGNKLEYLDSAMFINTQFVFDLNLSRNKITVLPDNTFTFLNNLTNLDLSFNPLVTSNLKQVFLHTLRVRKLNIRSMGLYVLPRLQLPYLTELDLSGNYIQELYSFHDLRHLRLLNLSGNKIVNVSNIAEHLPNSLRILDISQNPVRRITAHDMSSLKFVEDLNILDVKVANPTVFSKLRSLKKLRLTSSSNLGEIVSKVPGLQELIVRVIEPAIKDDMFAKLSNNTKLSFFEIYGENVNSISSNALESLANSSRLKIRIRNTKISDIPPMIFHTLKRVPHLIIDLSDNQIAALAPDSFYPNASSWDAVGTRSVIGGLDISNNPLQCDCGLVWFGHWLRRWLRESTQISAIQKDDIRKMVQRARSNTCLDPTTGRKLTFLEIFPEDLLCHASALSSSALSWQIGSTHLHFKVLVPVILLTARRFILTYLVI